MSWAGLANNQCVSFNNLQDAVNNGFFTALASIPVSTEQITKTDASTYVNVDTSYGPYAAKASNQLVVKSDLVTTTTTTTAIPCEEYFNNTANTYSVFYIDCFGNPVSANVGPNDSFCAQVGTCSGCGFLTLLGSC